MKIGVVCEGSNDFVALREMIKRIASAKGVPITAFDALQPRVDATSGRQIGGGGWTRVKVWLEENSGIELKKVLRPQLFSASPAYDFLIIHLDGDVVNLCNDFSAAIKAKCFQNVPAIVQEIENYIERKLEVPDDLDDNIIYAVPTMHTESWLVYAASKRPMNRNIENERIKKLGSRYLEMRYKLPLKDAALQAASALGSNLPNLRKELASLDHFANKIETAFS